MTAPVVSAETAALPEAVLAADGRTFADLCSSADPAERMAAIRVMVRDGIRGRRRPELATLAGDPDPEVRHAALGHTADPAALRRAWAAGDALDRAVLARNPALPVDLWEGAYGTETGPAVLARLLGNPQLTPAWLDRAVYATQAGVTLAQAPADGRGVDYRAGYTGTGLGADASALLARTKLVRVELDDAAYQVALELMPTYPGTTRMLAITARREAARRARKGHTRRRGR